jgi:hypothetical protein
MEAQMSDEYALLQQRIRERAYELWEEAGSPENDGQRFWQAARIAIDQEESKLDKEVADSFPASDPPSSSVVTGATGEHAAAAEHAADASSAAGVNATKRNAK